MKPKKIGKKLQFKKETVAELNVEEKSQLNGGLILIRSNLSGITCQVCDTQISCLAEPGYCMWCKTQQPGGCP